MSKPRTLRVVPQTGIMTADSTRHPEGIAVDLPTEEAEHLLALGHVVEVAKDEVEAGVPVEVLPAPAAPAPEPIPAPEPVQVVLPAEEPAAGRKRRS